MNSSPASAIGFHSLDMQNVNQVLAQIENMMMAQSNDIEQLDNNLNTHQLQLTDIENSFTHVKQTTNSVISSLITKVKETYTDTPLGLCLLLLTPKDLSNTVCVCKEWTLISSDREIQVFVWTNYVRVYNPHLFAQYKDNPDKSLMVATAKRDVRLASYDKV